MLPTKENIKQAASNLIEKFKSEMTQLTGIEPVVIFSLNEAEPMSPLMLEELENMMNAHCRKVYADLETWCQHGIRTRHRKREIVLYRQIFYYIARKMGYGLSFTGDYLGFDHATVLHGSRTIENLLDAGDHNATKLFNTLIDEYKKRLELKRVVQPNDNSGANTKSVLSPMLYAGIDKSKLDKLTSRTPHSKGEGALDH
jgi:hypothetical protein